MQHLSQTLIASTVVLSISTSWAATPITLPDTARLPDKQPAPEVLPIPIPEPPRATPSNSPVLPATLTYLGCYDIVEAHLFGTGRASASYWGFKPKEGEQACVNFCATGNAPGAQRVSLGQGQFPRRYTAYRKNDGWCFCDNELKGPPTGAASEECTAGKLLTVYGPSGTSGGIAARNPLDNVWHETESGWNGVWTRRGTSNVFDAVWTHGTGRVTAVLTIQIQGDTVSISRRQSSDGNDCNYTGRLAADRRSVSGTYACNRFPGPFSWQATIQL